MRLLFFLSGQEEAMMGQLVQLGPLVAVVDAVSWQDYLGGIIQHHCSSHRSNHAVLVVGYDTTGTHCTHTCTNTVQHKRGFMVNAAVGQLEVHGPVKEI